MDIDRVIDRIENIIDSAWQLPMSGGKVVVNSDEIFRILKDLRLSLPKEIIQAKNIIADREKILQNAQSDCEYVYKTAEEKVRQMIGESEIVKAAELRAEKILKNSQIRVNDIKSQAIDYLECIIAKLETTVSGNLSEIKKIKENIHENII
jgi:hypothetical protein